MVRKSDVQVAHVSVTFSSERNRTPLQIGHEITTDYVLCRASLEVASKERKTALGVGETPLAVVWAWPSKLGYKVREDRMKEFCTVLCDAWNEVSFSGHPMEIGHTFLCQRLRPLLSQANKRHPDEEPMPYLAALVCNSLFDLALYDAYGNLWNIGVFDSFTSEYMNHDLAWYFGDSYATMFARKYPVEFLVPREKVPDRLPVWHLVGGADALEKEDLVGDEPLDGYPVVLRDWIVRDGLQCLKIKLRGTDEAWDFNRIVRVGEICNDLGVVHLSVDFNCTVQDPAYVCRILDDLEDTHNRIWKKILYVEQPFPYDIGADPMDVHSVSSRKPLFMDESAHDWRFLELGVRLGWTGVALKTCKTLTGAMLMCCFGKMHHMSMMVQDLTNPALAIIPHVLLAANVGTVMGVEANSMQFCPEASLRESAVHPGLFRRRSGVLDLSSLGKSGFGYRLDEIERKRG